MPSLTANRSRVGSECLTLDTCEGSTTSSEDVLPSLAVILNPPTPLHARVRQHRSDHVFEACDERYLDVACQARPSRRRHGSGTAPQLS